MTKKSSLLHFEKNIWSVFSIVAFLFLSLSIILSIKSFENEVDTANNFTKNSSLAVSEKVTRIFSATEDTLQDISGEILRNPKQSPRQFHLLLRGYLAKSPLIAEYYFSDGNGKIIASSLEFPVKVAHIEDRILPLKDSRKPHAPASTSEPFMQIGDLGVAPNGDVLIPVTRSLEDNDHHFLGTVGGFVRADSFQDLQNDLGNFQSMSFAVINSAGIILTRYPFNQFYLGKEAKLLHRWKSEAFQAPFGTTEMTSNFDGKTRLVSYHKIQNFPLYAVVGVTRREVVQNWLPHLYTQLFLVISILFVGWLGALFLNRSLHALDSERSDTVNSYNELCELLTKINSKMGAAYFESLTLNFAQTFELNHVFVAELTKIQPATARTLALYSNHRFDQPLEYLLENTPCHRVMGHEVCFFDQNVQSLFPKDHLLQSMEIQCYLGVPLRDSDGTAIGILVAMHRQPRPDLERIGKLFQLFGDRAGAEMERLKKQRPQKSSAAS